jgi:hypothetical protein
MAIEDKVRKASRLLEEAYEESECKWCARNLQKLAKITDQMADIAPFTAETAKKVSTKTEDEIKQVGGKVGVLHDVVVAAQRESGNITDVSKEFNTEDEHKSPRGLSMDKRRATLIIGGSVAIGTGVGFVLNRVDEMVSVGKPWYYRQNHQEGSHPNDARRWRCRHDEQRCPSIPGRNVRPVQAHRSSRCSGSCERKDAWSDARASGRGCQVILRC